MPYGLNPGLYDRIKQTVQKYFGREEPEPSPKDEQPASDINEIMYRIRRAGRTKTRLWFKYNNTFRHVEPYSFRYRSAGMQPLFYGYCELHDEIHSFRIDRIQDVYNTDRPYEPRWPVEIA